MEKFYLEQAQRIVKQLTLKQKVMFLSGKDFWHLPSLRKYGLNEIMVTDGPCGLRKCKNGLSADASKPSYPATAFPAPSCLANSWDENLLELVGSSIAREAVDQKVSCVLGPGVNIKRSPLGGRNFEYLSEDPLLSGKLGASYIRGVQKEGVGSCVKHFLANNQETRRFSIDTIVDERALREIYLKPFEIAIKEAEPYSIMASYNKVNGTYMCENSLYLNSVLRDEWGFNGLVMSDWGGVSSFYKSVGGGLDLTMPKPKIPFKYYQEAIDNKTLSVADINTAASNVIAFILRSRKFPNIKESILYEKNFEVAKKAAEESMVLLKNEDNILPLSTKERITVIGPFAKFPRIGGEGSSKVNPFKVDSFISSLDEDDYLYNYTDGYSIDNDETDDELLDEVKRLVIRTKDVVIFVGLPGGDEAEGYDKKNIRLPKNQLEVIKAVSELNRNIVLVFQCGSPLEMPFIRNVKGILYSYLAGEASGSATKDILYGLVNPCGKLTESFPVKLEDTPCYNYFPGDANKVEYRESIFVGYRYYDKADVDVRFPFGYGLSYTKYFYSGLRIKPIVDKKTTNLFEISFYITNIGERRGKEIAQLYIGQESKSSTFKPLRELKKFTKVELEPHETKLITFILSKEDFSYFEKEEMGFAVEKGKYGIYIGPHSRELPLVGLVSVQGKIFRNKIGEENISSYFNLLSHPLEIEENEFRCIYGLALPTINDYPPYPYTINSSIGDMRSTGIGKKVYGIMNKQIKKMEKSDPNSARMIRTSLDESPIRMAMLASLSYSKVLGIVYFANGEKGKGISHLLFKK